MASDRELLRAALDALLKHYLYLVNSGDCGNWNPEEEPIVIQARAALAQPEAEPFDGQEALRALMAIAVVGKIDGHDVIRRESVRNIMERRLIDHPPAQGRRETDSEGRAAPRQGEKP